MCPDHGHDVAAKGPLVWKALAEAYDHFLGRPKGIATLRDRWNFFVDEELWRIDSIHQDDGFRSQHDAEYRRQKEARIEEAIRKQKEEFCARFARTEQPAPVLTEGELF